MFINNESLGDFLKGSFDNCPDEFSRYAADCILFYNGEKAFTCNSVRTEHFFVEVQQFEIEIDENNGDIRIDGIASVSFDVVGICEESENQCDHHECASENCGVDITFSIEVNLENFSRSGWMIDIT